MRRNYATPMRSWDADGGQDTDDTRQHGSMFECVHSPTIPETRSDGICAVLADPHVRVGENVFWGVCMILGENRRRIGHRMIILH